MRFGLFCLIMTYAVGCSNQPPRSRDEIFSEKQNLPGLYLTNKTHTRVLAPKSKGTFVDAGTQEEC